MSMLYLVPVVVIVGALAFSFVMRSRIQQAVAQGKGPMLFHDAWAGYFSSLADNEFIIGLWQGLAYTGARSGASQAAGAVLNAVSARAVGFSKYTPNVFVVLTSNGRVLIAEEFSEMGDRGNYKEVAAWGPGANAATGPSAIPEHTGPAPQNPFNPAVPLELAMVIGPDGNRYPLWLSPQGNEVTGQSRPISAALPIAATTAAAVWQNANQPRAQA